MKNLATTIAIAMLFASACGGRIDQLNGRGQWIPVGNPPVGYADTPSEPEESSDAASDSEETEVSPDDEGAAGSADQVSSDAEDRGTATDDDDNFMSSNPRNPATDSGTGGSSGKEPEEIATAGTPAEPNEGTAGATTVPDEGAAGATDAEVGDDGSDAVGAAGAPNAEPELGAAGASANPDEGGAGAVDSGATYCETVASDGDTLGYWGCCGAFVQSNEVQPGTLFKGSDAAVYYMAPNGYRYLFPTTMVLDSWYGIPDANGFPQSNPSVCSSVIEIPDEGVASIPLGGNVTIRPGTYVTGTVAGTERYVVSRGGVLHEIGLDAAKGIYGVADVVDAIFNSLDTFPVRLNADFSFANYTVGSPISSAADYDLEAERAVTLEEDLGISEDVVEEEPQIPPTVTVVPPGTAALFSGQVTTFKWQVSVPSTVSKVAWKQVIFQITTLDVTLSDFRIYKGAIELSDMEALIVRGSDGASVVHDVAVTGDTAADYIIVRLMNEEVIAVGSSITYTLRAMASDVGSESAVGMSFVAKLWSCATGLLVEHQDEHFINALSVKTDGSWAAYGPMIWSDMSAVPHSAAMREPGYGSADWTNCIDVPSGMWIIVQ